MNKFISVFWFTFLLIAGAQKLFADTNNLHTIPLPDPKEAKVDKPVLRHTHGMQGLGLQLGRGAIGYQLVLDWGTYFTTELGLKLWLGGEWRKQETAQYRSLFLQPMLSYTVLTNDRYF